MPEIDSINIELLDGLKADLIKTFKKAGKPRCASILQSFDYNDLIKLLQIGFGENHMFDSLQGKKNLTLSENILTFDWNQIETRLRHLKGGR